ncbi:hypothetical protein DM558_04365 [Entomomonas moraniae]|uniref:Uncharacterized protein n=1 Tax=Entomomonas moraniae TaxID=2213226 RepID=A0A3Q9JI78_9GAMM|nr:hypothetical protein DM558_04365 [Entomomonas moraniae]
MNKLTSLSNQFENILTNSDNPEKVIMEMYRLAETERKDYILASLVGITISKTRQLNHIKHK